MTITKDLGSLAAVQFCHRGDTRASGYGTAGTSVQRALLTGEGRFMEARAFVCAGPVTGSPSSFTASGRVQTSTDGSTWTDLLDEDGNTYDIAAVTVTANERSIKVRLSNALEYLTIDPTVTTTGGSGTPTVALITGFALLDPDVAPIADDDLRP